MSGHPEAKLVHSLRQHLRSRRLYGNSIAEVVVDADGSYRSSRYARFLEPMASVLIDGFRPDLLCAVQLPAGSLIAGIELKAGYCQMLWTRVVQAAGFSLMPSVNLTP